MPKGPPMTPPDRAPEPLSASREMTAEELVAAAEKMDVVDHAITIPAMWPRLILERALDAARDSRPVGEGLSVETLANALETTQWPSFVSINHPDAADPREEWVAEHWGLWSTEVARAILAALQAGPAAVRPVERELDVTPWNAALDAAAEAVAALPTSATVWTGEPLVRRGDVLLALLGVRRIVADSTTQPASTEAGE